MKGTRFRLLRTRRIKATFQQLQDQTLIVSIKVTPSQGEAPPSLDLWHHLLLSMSQFATEESGQTLLAVQQSLPGVENPEMTLILYSVGKYSHKSQNARKRAIK